jgi:hypothetical protein
MGGWAVRGAGANCIRRSQTNLIEEKGNMKVLTLHSNISTVAKTATVLEKHM